MKQKTICAVMMMKNEEANLPRCLSSLQNLVDKIVIVDTGSTDNSVSIAESYHAKVYHHPWENNFSLHRNQSIEYGNQEGCDWLLVIDCDEEVVSTPDQIEKFKSELADVPKHYNAMSVRFEDYQADRMVMQFSSTRLIRSGYARYIGTIHNQLDMDYNGGIVVSTIELVLRHHGYFIDPEKKAAKKQRTIGLLMAEIEQDPTNERAMFFLAQSYAWHGDNDLCVDWSIKHVKTCYEKNKVPGIGLFFTGIRSAMVVKRVKDAIYLLEEGLKIDQNDLDLLFAMVEIGEATKNLKMMVEGARRYIYVYNNFETVYATKGEQFCYTRNQNALGVCLYNLSLVSFADAIEQMNYFGRVFPTMAEEIQLRSKERAEHLVKQIHESFTPLLKPTGENAVCPQ